MEDGHTEHLQNACPMPVALGDAESAFHATPLCSRNLPSAWSRQRLTRDIGENVTPSSVMLQIFLCLSQFQIFCTQELLKHPHHSNVSISKLHFLHGLFHPEAVQKSCRPCTRIWVMENVYFKERGWPITCWVQQKRCLQPDACM